MTRFAQVAVLAQLGRAGGLFTYGLPADLAPVVQPGFLVRVPFTKRQFQGIVYSLADSCELARVRDVLEVLDPEPVVTPHQLELARWIVDYYAAPMSDVLGAMIPPGLGRKTLYVLAMGTERNGHTSQLRPDLRLVLDMVPEAGQVLQVEVERQLEGVDVERAVASLLKRGLLTRSAELAPPRVSPRIERVVTVTPDGVTALRAETGLRRAPRQRQILETLAERGSLAAPELSRLIPGAQGPLSSLRDKGLVQIEEQAVSRSPLRSPIATTQPLHLSPAQRAAYERIARSLHAARPDLYLLHGVTGSGKTEVYLQSIAETVRRGKQAIMMVPEISLTPQAVERVAGRFPGRVAVLHSMLSDGERVDEWQRIRRGQVDVVVGARSALFAPLACPGLIIVDEEHDPSYKQVDNPRYHARDAAAVLGRLTGATIVLGSATPDVGTYHAARQGRLQLLELPDRPVWGASARGQARPMPPVEVVDLRQELKAGNRGMFSSTLLAALHQTLDSGQQALLFLNRRGTATVVLCRDCGHAVRCPNCDIPYTYHAAATRLICHRCDKRVVSPRLCPACHGPRVRYLGVGTQRVEEEVQRLFPQARVLRWDRDAAGGKDAHEQTLQRFARHEADFLVGTQMIAKGLDFPLVTLVGVISADSGLHMPDFRAPERSFQLLTQVAGRAGRASLPSRVVVQTYTPEHYAIQAAREHDYHRFFREEMSFRRAARYPPHARLVRFGYSADAESKCRQSAENLAAILQRAIAEQQLSQVEVIGPAPCFVARVKNRFYWQLIARAPGASALHALLDYVPAGWTIDVDPVDLL